MSAALLAIGCGTTEGRQDADSTPLAAWWYDMDFEPVSSSVHGIDVSRFDPTWKLASALDAKMLEGRIPPVDLARYTDSGMSFALQDDLDGDGMPEEVLAGVFSTRDGGGGRFVAITRDGQLVRHFSQPGPAGFSALLKYGDEVRWYKCLECGEFESIRWSGESFLLE
ncbi:hypothetical protein [Lysobacter sp. F6437]|uniref:hypothetical protein n=1 Tax=Lysobacter sp. F6437 TaxID=3459296 RepID=UPI00403E0ED9